MKKLFLLLLIVFSTLSFVGCTEKPEEEQEPVEITVTLTIDDIEIYQNDTHTIEYITNPVDQNGNMSYEIISGDTEAITISNGVVTAVAQGVATVEATFTNKSNSMELFTTTTSFTVTVHPPEAIVSDEVLNASFEDGISGWMITEGNVDTFSTEVVDNLAHTGESAFSLWYDIDEDSMSEAIDLEIKQTLTNIEAGTYLFDLWYQGVATSVTMTVIQDDSVLATQMFSGFDYRVPEGHNGYVNFGIEVTLSSTSTIDIIVEVVGQDEVWGYIDDIDFSLGTEDDLVLPPPVTEEGYINFINDGNFSALDAWTIDISGSATNKTVTEAQGALSIWSDGPAMFDIHQSITLMDASYNFAIYLNGGVVGTEFNAAEAYIYITNGTDTHTVDLTPEGWGTGELKRISINDIELNGTYDVGIYIEFTSGTNNWINLDDFTLFSLDYPLTQADIDASNNVNTLIENLPTVLDLTTADETNLIAARDAYDLLTDIQKSMITDLDKLVALEERMIQLKLPPTNFDEFNLHGTFETDDWSMSTIGWTVTNARTWTDGSWPQAGSMSYNMFHEETSLQGSFSHDADFVDGDYTFSVYVAGDGITSITVTIGSVTETLTGFVSTGYTMLEFDFTMTTGTQTVTIEVVRASTDGWLHFDNAMLEEQAE